MTPAPPTRAPNRGYRTLALQLVVLGVAGVGAHYAAIRVYRTVHSDPPPNQTKHLPALTVADAELDLGRVWETSNHNHVIHISNLLDRPVTITGFANTCDCLGITPAEAVSLQAHETKAFTLQLSLLYRGGAVPQPDGVPFQVHLAARYSTDDQGGAQRTGA